MFKELRHNHKNCDWYQFINSQGSQLFFTAEEQLKCRSDQCMCVCARVCVF